MQEYKIESLRELDNKSLYFRYKFIKYNYKELYRIFAKHSNTKDFTSSRHALFILILFPATINLYYSFINPGSIFKTPMRIAAVLGCILNFGSQIHNDLIEAGKKDTNLGNTIKKLFQNIAYEEPGVHNFGEETLKIIRERELKKAKQE